jgi:hypothetical protein
VIDFVLDIEWYMVVILYWILTHLVQIICAILVIAGLIGVAKAWRII